MKFATTIVIIFLIISLLACRENSFYWKEGTQMIGRCDSGVFNIITIEDSVNAFAIYIERTGAGSHEIDLTNKLPDYSFSIMRKGEKKRISDFSLRPNAQYEISHTAPNDATAARIKIATDGSGRIKYASKTVCD